MLSKLTVIKFYSILKWLTNSISTTIQIKYNIDLPQLTEASSKWLQSWLPIPLWGHSNNCDSDPVQDTSSNQIGPLPSPMWANDKAVPVIDVTHSR